MSFSLAEAAKLLDIRKVPAEVWLAVALASGFVLLVPTALTTQLGVEGLRGAHRPYLGAAFVLSASMLVSKSLTFVGRLIKESVRRWRDAQQHRYLAPDQKAVLRRYISEDTCTLMLGLDDGVAQGLEQVGLIYRSAQVGSMHRGFAYNIKPWLRLHLLKHPEFIQETDAGPTHRSEQR